MLHSVHVGTALIVLLLLCCEVVSQEWRYYFGMESSVCIVTQNNVHWRKVVKELS